MSHVPFENEKNANVDISRQKFLIVTDIKDSSQIVLRQAEAQKTDSAIGSKP